MKKVISLVALVFVLSSFSLISNGGLGLANENISDTYQSNIEKMESIKMVEIEEGLDCFTIASAAADAWMEDTGGSWSDSVPVYDAIYAVCSGINVILNFFK